MLILCQQHIIYYLVCKACHVFSTLTILLLLCLSKAINIKPQTIAHNAKPQINLLLLQMLNKC